MKSIHHGPSISSLANGWCFLEMLADAKSLSMGLRTVVRFLCSHSFFCCFTDAARSTELAATTKGLRAHGYKTEKVR